MTDIKNLLNPAFERPSTVSSTCVQTPNPTMTDSPSPRKKAKLTKDAAIFTAGPIRGECRFPPDEFQDEQLAAHHERFEVTPFGEIADYPRHIPYNSGKKLFQERTNREYLEVFQYTFRVPEHKQTYTMLWDYNIGLVRTTPLFKCTGHSKTTPAKVLSRNPGLREICHSITGGALVAQGYWIPMAAAKAIATTFCYDVRYALTPVFGHDFPSLCLRPEDEGFGDMTIDPAIIKHCTKLARQFREEEKEGIPGNYLARALCQSSVVRKSLSRRSKTIRNKRIRKFSQRYASPYSSSYPSDTGSEGGCTSSASTPEPLYCHNFTPLNTPRQVPRSVPFPQRKLPSPIDILASSNTHRHMLDTPLTPVNVTSRYSSPEISPKTMPRKIILASIDEYERDLGRATAEQSPRLDMDWLNQSLSEEKQKAAYALLSLKFSNTATEVAHGLGITFSTNDETNKRWTLP